ncbi:MULTISPECIES: hypothetical protein [Methylosinus]|uniref:PH domain-containing protein n=1 Tax=Methylosinus trichosporium (strain ATCC 35070 / NCIMB 11131 / UNIQEM 75 / OB3b) TaxID=595536 RepID=A0A2D2D4Z5_METT3|nr:MULTISPECIES: hypothetical protein [Methylosinus]ATQ70080.1 hypothetical protein CQW49_20965 [Methylosinus trichosporium OB3b]OBS54245.1 hypothetical protein A8B73_01630 [Methylosinus sp. 3S-1]
MSSTEEFHEWISALEDRARSDVRRRANRVAIVAFIAAVAGIVALYAFAGQHVLAIWAAVALFGWLFVAGAARVSSD